MRHVLFPPIAFALCFAASAPSAFAVGGDGACTIECPAGPPGPTGAAGPAGPTGPAGPPGPAGEVFMKVCTPTVYWYACKRGSTEPATTERKAHMCSQDLTTGEIQRYARTGRNLRVQIERVARLYNRAEMLCDPTAEEE